MLTSFGHTGRSTHVEMQLLIDGKSLAIAQMGPDFLLLDEPSDCPPCKAAIVLVVDGKERRWDVRLPAGMSSAASRIAISIDR